MNERSSTTLGPVRTARTRLSPLRPALRASLRDDSRVTPAANTVTTLLHLHTCCEGRLSPLVELFTTTPEANRPSTPPATNSERNIPFW